MKKRTIAIILCLSLLIPVTSCNKKSDNEVVAKPENSVSEKQPEAPNTDTPGKESPEDISTNEPEEKPGTEIYNSEKPNSAIVESDGAIVETGVETNDKVTNNSYFIPDSEQGTGEKYSEKGENSFISTEKNNLSTFAADVDTASYSRLRRYIMDGMIEYIPTDAVRIEEMINYFSYDYKEPEEDIPFSTQAELFKCPWNNENVLLRIGINTKEPDLSSLPPSNLVFLIDVSGSMSSADKLPLVQQAFSMLGEQLRKEDKISIVTYASNDTVVLDGASGNDQYRIQTAIENLAANGSTNGSQGIITAYEIARKHFIEGGNNRVILATDGDLNVGITDTEQLKNLIIEKKESGIYLSVMGFGTGNLQDDKMEALADNGNGNYSYIDSKMEAKRVLVEEMGGTLFTVAKDVKFQTEFNKDSVSEYRLIGYENRVMANEDFEDDKKDGGEIGAGHRVTILYELKMKDTSKDKWLTLNIRYKAPEANYSTLKTYDIGKEQFTKSPSESSIFASSVAQFGMILQKSEYAKGSYKDVYTRLSSLKCVKEDPYKKEFLSLVEKFI